ncbi:class I SAM-dependent methyltransferase [Methylococcus mesophilus]|uniref:class I SAM-dependent methyltransferase n=1 Tax=Methylococcus mesophilus TaxID=2993564 RepID=UPI00224B45CA|nr:class I SAM-dependent methyltransferase [Methylococcus mesophilus]UZR28745.1 class I SAM-dependent methyltransferase [Methylococcus mesophilus]
MSKKHRSIDFVPKTFDDPEKLPGSLSEAEDWQKANRTYWESNPMRYDWNQEIGSTEGSKAFFDEIDRRFFETIKRVMPWKEIPFDNVIPFDELKNKRVLEIGVGSGSHAALIAPRALSYTGIDLTDYAVRMTSERMKVIQINADIRQMDAEVLQFPDASFDFVWSWGVIHHSSNTLKILEEINRVLMPGGRAVIMIYHRGWWNYYTVGGLAYGIICGGFLRHGSLARVVQAATDGALARYYSKRSWVAQVNNLFSVKSMSVIGNKADLFPIPAGRIKDILMRLAPDAIARFFLTDLHMGSLLISRLSKDT